MKKNDLIYGNIGKAILLFVLPLIAGSLIQQLYITVDAIIVGRFAGKVGLAAIDSVNTLFKFPINFMNGLASGATIIISKYVGARDKENLHCSIRTALTVAMVLGAISSIAGILLSPCFLKVMRVPADIHGATLTYCRIYFGGLWSLILYNMAAGILRAFGDSKRPLYVLILSSLINVVGDFLLVGVFGMGVAGAAIATVMAQAVSVVLAIIILKRKKYDFKIQKQDFRINKQCKRFIIVGLPLALQEFLTQMSFLALCAFINKLGLEASSGYGVACKIVSFAMLVPSALMQAMASFVSQNVGAGKHKRAKQSMLTGMGVGLVVGVIVFSCVWNFGDILTSVFTTDTAVIQKGADYLIGFAPETIVTAIMFSMVGFFNGYEKTVWVMTQGLIQTLLVRLPLAYVMSIQPNASLTKIALAAPIATCCGILLNVMFYFVFFKKQTRQMEQA